jgi:hypothetical protein
LPTHVTGIETISEGSASIIDYTQIPSSIDRSFESWGVNSVRPVIIHIKQSGGVKRNQKSLLAKPVSNSIDFAAEKKKAFDLLDALTKSGAITVDHASLHIIVAASQCFQSTLFDSIVSNNTNPIEKVERSTLIMASTVFQQPFQSIVQEGQIGRLNEHSMIKGDERDL